MAKKAAAILVEAFEKELKDSGTIIASAELRKNDKLVGAGHTLVGCIDVGSYTVKVFDPEMLPTTNSMRQSLQVAVNLTSTTLIQLYLIKILVSVSIAAGFQHILSWEIMVVEKTLLSCRFI